jgi:hypothetical protein
MRDIYGFLAFYVPPMPAPVCKLVNVDDANTSPFSSGKEKERKLILIKAEIFIRNRS